MSVRVNQWHANHAETDVQFMGSWSSGWPGQDASGHRSVGVVAPFAPRVGAGPDAISVANSAGLGALSVADEAAQIPAQQRGLLLGRPWARRTSSADVVNPRSSRAWRSA